MPTTDHKIAAMQITLGVAMMAKLGTMDVTSLRLAVIAVTKSFGVEDPLRVALTEFADRFPCVRRDPDSLQLAGDDLFEAVRRATWPVLPARADIEG